MNIWIEHQQIFLDLFHNRFNFYLCFYDNPCIISFYHNHLKKNSLRLIWIHEFLGVIEDTQFYLVLDVFNR